MKIRTLSDYPMLVGRLVTTWEQQHAPGQRRGRFLNALVHVGLPLLFIALIAFVCGAVVCLVEAHFYFQP